ncbi:CLUMA_CG007539, isoform A [Clunio marinus]|uniref:CLUMA_CG007539, isoform A n=1 Tax=Clunio marinus TaxID=568069 RepID=A0A1J1I527_9DIPT|nr:CLUMA_CG007539, isoform A [Clunio marinus]
MSQISLQKNSLVNPLKAVYFDKKYNKALNWYRSKNFPAYNFKLNEVSSYALNFRKRFKNLFAFDMKAELFPGKNVEIEIAWEYLNGMNGRKMTKYATSSNSQTSVIDFIREEENKLCLN